MAELTTILTQDDLNKIVASLARRISSDYDGRELLCIGVLKGAFIFMADLIRLLTVPVKVGFLQASSYGLKTVSSGDPQVTGNIDMVVDEKDLLLIEDIVDTGMTLKRTIGHLKTLHPKSLKVCALIDKQERRDTQVSIDYAGYIIDGGFLVGFGLDYAEKYRNLPGIFQLNS
jgi:hypoxanthine phosphoribosyltransferase